MSKVQFEPIEHVYSLDGKALTGVTSILAVIAKPFLIPWAVKLQYEYTLKNSTQDGTKYYITKDILETAKGEHTREKEEAGKRGTEVHTQVDNYFTKNEYPENFRARAIVDWIKQKGFKIVTNEKIVYSEKYWYAGTLDLLVQDQQGRYWIVDFKTSKNISAEYLYQMAGYEIAYCETENDLQIAGYIICHVDLKANITEYILEDAIVKEQCKQAFLAANTIYKAGKNINLNNHKYGKPIANKKSN